MRFSEFGEADPRFTERYQPENASGNFTKKEKLKDRFGKCRRRKLEEVLDRKRLKQELEAYYDKD